MKQTTFFLLSVLIFAASVAAQPCLHAAKEVAPVLSAETRAAYEKNLAAAEAVHLEKLNEADSIIWLGRRMAYLGHYKKAIWIFSSGMKLHPNDARFYRHRGHRYITLRCFDDAINDLNKAASLVEGKPDEIESDGIPNAKNIPTSTLKTNIYYHLGLAYYLKGDFKRASDEFVNCFNAARNADMKVAAGYWAHMSVRRLGNKKAAEYLIFTMAPDGLEIIENHDYYKLAKLSQDRVKPEALLSSVQGDSNTLASATLGYGVGNHFLYNGKKEKALSIFRNIVAGNQWASFGYIAAEAELSR